MEIRSGFHGPTMSLLIPNPNSVCERKGLFSSFRWHHRIQFVHFPALHFDLLVVFETNRSCGTSWKRSWNEWKWANEAVVCRSTISGRNNPVDGQGKMKFKFHNFDLGFPKAPALEDETPNWCDASVFIYFGIHAFWDIQQVFSSRFMILLLW